MKKLYITFLVLILALSIILPVGAVNAGQTFNVSGTMKLYTPVVGVDEMVGNVMLASGTHINLVGGSLVGTANEYVRNWTDFATLKFHVLGLQAFTGTFNGKTGQYFAELYRVGQSFGDYSQPQTVTGSCKTIVKILGGTGDFANLRGTLCVNLSVHFEPNDVAPDVPLVWSGTYKGKLTFVKNNTNCDDPGAWNEWQDCNNWKK